MSKILVGYCGDCDNCGYSCYDEVAVSSCPFCTAVVRLLPEYQEHDEGDGVVEIETWGGRDNSGPDGDEWFDHNSDEVTPF